VYRKVKDIAIIAMTEAFPLRTLSSIRPLPIMAVNSMDINWIVVVPMILIGLILYKLSCKRNKGNITIRYDRNVIRRYAKIRRQRVTITIIVFIVAILLLTPLGGLNALKSLVAMELTRMAMNRTRSMIVVHAVM